MAHFRRSDAVFASAVLILLLTACAKPVAHQTGSPGNSSSQPTARSSGNSASGLQGTGKIVHATNALKLAQSSKGEFSIAIPLGWAIQPSQDGQIFNITAGAQSEPKIYVAAAIAVSDLRATELALGCAQQANQNPLAALDATACSGQQLLDQLQDSSHEWSAADALQMLLQFESAVAGNRYSTPQVASLSNTSVRYSVNFQTSAGSSLTGWGIVAMGYMANPSFRGYTSLAFVTGCEAPPQQVAALQTVCAQAFSSFHPAESWLTGLAQLQVRRYQLELQLIAQQIQTNQQTQQMLQSFSSSMQQMQQQEFQSLEESNRRVADDWIATLGGQVNKQDPSNGQIYLVDGGWRSYCVSNLGNIMESQLPIQKNEYFGDDPSESCSHIMQTPAIS